VRLTLFSVRLKGEAIVAEGNALGNQAKNLLRPEGASQSSTTREDSSGIDSGVR
jgi:hypothetical protein